VGSSGFVLGIDLKRVEPIDLPNVRTVTGDVTDSQITQSIRELLPRSADVIISDVSPNVSGVWELDHARQIDLARQSLRIATSVLRLRGNFFVKVFQGDMLHDLSRKLNNISVL
jgi:23S rRNA methylase